MSSDIVQVHEVVDPTTLLSPSELAFFGFLNRARTQPAEFARELEGTRAHLRANQPTDRDIERPNEAARLQCGTGEES